jgi:hypothetical protein
VWQGRMSNDDEALVRTTLSPKASEGENIGDCRPYGSERIRLVAVHYPVRPGNGLRSVRPVRIRILSVAQLVEAGGLHRRMGASGQIHRGTVTAGARIRTGAVTAG